MQKTCQKSPTLAVLGFFLPQFLGKPQDSQETAVGKTLKMPMSMIFGTFFASYRPPSGKIISDSCNKNKKVLLRECKRHTACRVASTPYVVLTGYPPCGQGTPPARVPPWPGYPPCQGTPLARVPPPAGPGRVPPLPQLDLAGYPPPPLAAPWHSGKCCKALWDMGTPPPPPKTKWKYYLPVVLRTRAVIMMCGYGSLTMGKNCVVLGIIFVSTYYC